MTAETKLDAAVKLGEHTIVCPFCQRGDPCATSALLKAADQAERYFVVVEESPLADLPEEPEFD